MKERKATYLISGIALVLSALLLGKAYTYKYRQQETIVVTGLGETEFTSDLIVWTGTITTESTNVESGYRALETSKEKVEEFLKERGIASESVIFQFVNVEKIYEAVYTEKGIWAGDRLRGYQLKQRFTIESHHVETVEAVSREISSLIAQGVSIEAWAPEYYYTKLDDVKLNLIESASQDARNRAEKIARNAGKRRIGKLISSRLGVFQITGANTNEEFSAGGSFNTSNRHKKARVTIRAEYRIR